jgi:hypothetical protein
MDVKAATEIRDRVLKCIAELNEAVRASQDECSDVEFRTFRKTCGSLMYDLWEQLLVPIFREHPQLKPDVMKDIEF